MLTHKKNGEQSLIIDGNNKHSVRQCMCIYAHNFHCSFSEGMMERGFICAIEVLVFFLKTLLLLQKMFFSLKKPAEPPFLQLKKKKF